MQTQDRQAGPETDNAVAIHVMGYLWSAAPDFEYGLPMLLPATMRSSLWTAVEQPESISALSVYYVPSFSSDMLAAWSVFEHFAWPKYYTRLVRTNTGNWRCDIELNGGDGPVRSAYAETVPLAICRAALAAVGVDR